MGRDESVKNCTKEILSHMLSQTLWRWQQVVQELRKASFHIPSDKSYWGERDIYPNSQIWFCIWPWVRLPSMDSGFSVVAELISFPFPFSSMTQETQEQNRVCFCSQNYHCRSARPVSLLDSPGETRLYFDSTACMWFAEMGCWGFPPVHDLKFLFPHFDYQFYIWFNSCFLPGFLGKQFVKTAALCPSALPVWVFDCTPCLFLNLTERRKAQN